MQVKLFDVSIKHWSCHPHLSLQEFCASKAQSTVSAGDTEESEAWSFLSLLFEVCGSAQQLQALASASAWPATALMFKPLFLLLPGNSAHVLSTKTLQTITSKENGICKLNVCCCACCALVPRQESSLSTPGSFTQSSILLTDHLVVWLHRLNAWAANDVNVRAARSPENACNNCSRVMVEESCSSALDLKT